MKQEFGFDSQSLTDKKIIVMAMRGFFGDPCKIWGSKRVVKERTVVSRTSLGLPREALEQFRQLCLKKGIQLSDAEIAREAHNLINFTRVVNGKTPYLDMES